MLDYEPVSSHQAQAFVSGKRGLTQRSLYPEGSPKKRFKMLKTNTFPGDTQRQGENFGLERCWEGDYTRRLQGRLSWRPGWRPETVFKKSSPPALSWFQEKRRSGGRHLLPAASDHGGPAR